MIDNFIHIQMDALEDSNSQCPVRIRLQNRFLRASFVFVRPFSLNLTSYTDYWHRLRAILFSAFGKNTYELGFN